MQIQWLGQSYFKIQAKNNEGEVVIATDPYSEDYGLKVQKFPADIVTVSHDHNDHNNLDAIGGEPFVIHTPGEYETKGVFIYGLPAHHDAQQGQDRGRVIIFKFTVEGINVAHLSDLGHTLSDEQLDQLGNVDILLVPVGGVFTIDAKKAVEIISAIEPRIVIPMHYDIPGLKFKSESKLDSVEKFIKESGLPVERMDKLKIAKKDLPAEETKIIVLNP